MILFRSTRVELACLIRGYTIRRSSSLDKGRGGADIVTWSQNFLLHTVLERYHEG